MRLVRICLATSILAVIALTSCSRQPSALPSPPAAPSVATIGKYPLVVTDDLGTQVSFDSPPQRIISLAPNITEILFAIGLQDRVVGVTSFCDYPPEAAHKEQVGGYTNFSVEKIVSLDPDVVFAAHGSPMALIESLYNLGLKVFGLRPLSYDEVTDRIELIGRICDVQPAATTLATHMLEARDEIRVATQALPPQQRPLALCVVGLDPLWVAGPGTFIDDMLQVCGARNVAGDIGKKWSEISMEAVVAADPDILIITYTRNDEKSAADYLRDLQANETWRGVKAVQQGRIIIVDEDLVTLPGPRLAEGLRVMARSIHPKLFGDYGERRGE